MRFVAVKNETSAAKVDAEKTISISPGLKPPLTLLDLVAGSVGTAVPTYQVPAYQMPLFSATSKTAFTLDGLKQNISVAM